MLLKYWTKQLLEQNFKIKWNEVGFIPAFSFCWKRCCYFAWIVNKKHLMNRNLVILLPRMLTTFTIKKAFVNSRDATAKLFCLPGFFRYYWQTTFSHLTLLIIHKIQKIPIGRWRSKNLKCQRLLWIFFINFFKWNILQFMNLRNIDLGLKHWGIYRFSVLIQLEMWSASLKP